MANYKKLAKEREVLEKKIVDLSILLSVQALKNGGTLNILNSEINLVRDKYFSVEKTFSSYIVTIKD